MIGITELGRNENSFPNQLKPSNIVKKWYQNGIASSAWNQRDTRSAFEPGGVMSITRDKSTAHTIKRGKETKNLGRWVGNIQREAKPKDNSHHDVPGNKSSSDSTEPIRGHTPSQCSYPTGDNVGE